MADSQDINPSLDLAESDHEDDDFMMSQPAAASDTALLEMQDQLNQLQAQFSTQMSSVKATENRLRRERNRLRTQLEQERGHSSSYQQRLEASSVQLTATQLELVQSESRRQALQGKSDALNLEAARLSAANHALSAANARLEQVNSDQATRLVSRGTELQHSVAHAVELKANLAGLQSDVTAAAVRELELVTKVSTLEQNIAASCLQAQTDGEQIEHQTSVLTTLELRIEKLNQTVACQRAALDEAAAKQAGKGSLIVAQLATAKGQLAALQAALSLSKSQTLATVDATRAALAKDVAQVVAIIGDDHVARRNREKQRLASLETDRDELETKLTHCKQHLLAKDSELREQQRLLADERAKVARLESACQLQNEQVASAREVELGRLASVHEVELERLASKLRTEQAHIVADTAAAHQLVLSTLSGSHAVQQAALEQQCAKAAEALIKTESVASKAQDELSAVRSSHAMQLARMTEESTKQTEQLTTALNAATSQLQAAQHQISELLAERTHLTEAQAASSATLTAALAAEATLKAAEVTFKAKVEQLESTLAALSKNNANYHTGLERLSAKATELEALMVQRDCSLNERLNAFLPRLQQSTTALARVQAHLVTTAATAEESMSEKLMMAEDTAAVLEQDLDTLKRQSLGELERVQASLAAEKETLKTVQIKLQSVKAEAKEQYAGLVSEKAELVSSMKTLSSQNTSLEAELSQVRSQLEQVQRERQTAAATREQARDLAAKTAVTTTATPQLHATPVAILSLERTPLRMAASPRATTPAVQEQVQNSVSPKSPMIAKRASAPPLNVSSGICICLTGFKPGSEGYTLSDKQTAMAAVRHLGVKLHKGKDFDEEVTHVIAPPDCRTIKVLAATLKGRWLMPVDWLLSSAAANEVLPEAAHGGSRLTASPFKDRTLLMSKDFVENSKESKRTNVVLLFETYGGGRIVRSGHCDMLLTLDASLPALGVQHLTWSELLALIPVASAIDTSEEGIKRQPLADTNTGETASAMLETPTLPSGKRAARSRQDVSLTLGTPTTTSHKKPKLSLSRRK